MRRTNIPKQKYYVILIFYVNTGQTLCMDGAQLDGYKTEASKR